MRVNGIQLANDGYERFHAVRFDCTMRLLKDAGARRVIEVGAHPWCLTGRIIDDPQFEVVATVSAQEATLWPDDIGVTVRDMHIVTQRGNSATFPNYAANIERTRFSIGRSADTVVACEIIEHLVRAPHVFFLNMNDWLPVGGRLLLTTPNGCQFSNPFRRAPRMPAYRAHAYERHAYVYALRGLVDLAEKCGFSVQRVGYWNPYKRSGASRVYDVLSRLPSEWCREKFGRAIYLTAVKRQAMMELSELPAVYVPSPDWEYIRRGPGA